MTDKIQEFIEAMHSHGIGPAAGVSVHADDKRHRYQVEGDHRGSKNGEYQLRVDPDGFAVGWFKSYKTLPDAVTWTSRSHKKRATAEEKAEWAARVEADRQRRAAEDAALRERAKAECQRIWDDARDATGAPYLAARGLGDWMARVWEDLDRFEDVLLVPAYRAGELVGLQKVYPDGGKFFVTGSDLSGSWCMVGDAADGCGVLECEGYATAVTLHLATGMPVAVAFNAGNLKAVAKSLSEAGHTVTICADADLWTPHPKHRAMLPDVLPARDAPEWVEWREAGYLLNTGLDAGMVAAAAIGGAQVLYPVEGGDWDDVRQRDGLDAVRDRIMGALNMAQQPEPMDDWEPDYSEVGPSYEDMHPADELMALTGPLGYDKEKYYFLPRTKGQIIELTANALGSINNLYQLANLSDLTRLLGTEKPSEIVSMVAPRLIQACHAKGIYEPVKIYGTGAWSIGGDIYVNTGRKVWKRSTGEFLDHTDVKIDGAFVRGPEVYNLDVEPLRTKEAHEYYKICQMPSWKKPISGLLLAGWSVIAPVGGALDHRPHIFVTGPKGSGKSTIIEKVVEAILAGCHFRQDGGSTEAGLRRLIGESSRPAVMDEFEGENKRDAENVQKIIFWARKAFSGGIFSNAYGTFRQQSCVCFSAINPLILQGADNDRITLLELEVDNRAGSADRYRKFSDAIHEVLTKEYASRMVKRTLTHIDTLKANAKTFTKHAADILGSKRDGDVIGPMLAGAYLLHSDKLLTDEGAKEWMEKQDWSWHGEDKDISDSEKLIQHIMTSRVRYDIEGQSRESSIGEMVWRVSKGTEGADASAMALRQYGLMVRGDELLVANSSRPLQKILADTPWVSWKRTLGDYKGAHNYGNKPVYFMAGLSGKVTAIPLMGILSEYQEVEW